MAIDTRNETGEALAHRLAIRDMQEDPRRDPQLAAEVRVIMSDNQRFMEWRLGLTTQQESLYNQGLLAFGYHPGETNRRVFGNEGKIVTIPTLGVSNGEGATIFVPRTQEAQKAHEEVIARPKSSAI